MIQSDSKLKWHKMKNMIFAFWQPDWPRPHWSRNVGYAMRLVISGPFTKWQPCATIHKLSKVSGYSKTVDVCGPSSAIILESCTSSGLDLRLLINAWERSNSTDWSTCHTKTHSCVVESKGIQVQNSLMLLKSIQDYQPLKFCLISGLSFPHLHVYALRSVSQPLCHCPFLAADVQLTLWHTMQIHTHTMQAKFLVHHSYYAWLWLCFACSTTQATLVVAAATSRSAGDVNCAGKVESVGKGSGSPWTPGNQDTGYSVYSCKASPKLQHISCTYQHIELKLDRTYTFRMFGTFINT